MAKVKDPFGAREARGSVGGITASRNTSGQILRCKASPVQPRTNSQTTIRAAMQRMTYKYQSLSAENIILWQDFASNWPVTDVFGDSITLSGMNWFVALNSRLDYLGKAIQEQPPLTPNCDIDLSGSIFNDVSTSSIMMSLSGTLPSGGALWISYSSELPLSSNFKKKSLKLRKTFSNQEGPTITLIDGTDILFGGTSRIQFEHFFTDSKGRSTPVVRTNIDTKA